MWCVAAGDKATRKSNAHARDITLTHPSPYRYRSHARGLLAVYLSSLQTARSPIFPAQQRAASKRSARSGRIEEKQSCRKVAASGFTADTDHLPQHDVPGWTNVVVLHVYILGQPFCAFPAPRGCCAVLFRAGASSHGGPRCAEPKK